MSLEALARAGRIVSADAGDVAAHELLERAKRLESVALYAEAALGSGPHAAHVRELDRMRRTRNRVEYDEWGGFGAAEIRADLERARAIVAAVEASWPTSS